MRFPRWLQELLFPGQCICCGRIAPEGICDRCLASPKLERVGENPCPRCGRDGEFCVCGISLGEDPDKPRDRMEFQQLVAPFYYTGIARKGIIAMKFHHNRVQSRWLSAEMAEVARRYIHLEQLDWIVPVPLSRGRLRERGYNQAELLAEDLSRRLKIPLNRRILVKVRENIPQHTLRGNQRVHNVDKVYRVTENVWGKRILLVDDVSTSGSTLSSCSKTLYQGGADVVLCCVGAVTRLDFSDMEPLGKKDCQIPRDGYL